MIDVLRAQLVAARAQIDAALAMLDGLQPAASPEPAGCPHSETENIGTFGAPRLRCMACQQIVEPAV